MMTLLIINRVTLTSIFACKVLIILWLVLSEGSSLVSDK